MRALKYLTLLPAFVCAALAFGQGAVSDSAPTEKKTVAIFVRNDSGDSSLNKYSKILESALSSRISSPDWSVVDYDLAIRNLNDYLGNPNAKYKTQAKVFKRDLESQNYADLKLFEDASGTRIAEFVGADCIMAVSVSSLGKDKRSYEGCGVKTVTETYTLRLNYTLSSSSDASSLAGGNVSVSQSFRDSDGLKIETSDIENTLFSDAAESIASDFKKKTKFQKIEPTSPQSATLNLSFAISNLDFPKIVKEGEKYYVTKDIMTPSISGVNAEIDGVLHTVELSDSANVSLSKGIHYIRINQPDIKPIEQTIFVTGKPDQKIRLNLRLSDELMQRWKADIEFFRSIVEKMKETDARVELSDAEAERLRGLAEMFKNSHIYFDPQTYGTNIFPVF